MPTALFGLTTRRNRTVAVHGSHIHFQFPGKRGVAHAITLRERRLARIGGWMRKLPAQHLFQYRDGVATACDWLIEVNEFLRDLSGADYTAKGFLTQAETLQAALELHCLPAFFTEVEAKRNGNHAIAAVAKALGNTPVICSKCSVDLLSSETDLPGEPLLATQALPDRQDDGDMQAAGPGLRHAACRSSALQADSQHCTAWRLRSS